MTLRFKTLLILGLTFLGLFVLVLVASEFILLQEFEELEEERAADNVQSVTNVIDDRLEQLAQAGGAWSFWDDTIAYVQDPEANADFEAGLTRDVFIFYDINLMAYVDREGRLVYAEGWNIITLEEVRVLPSNLNEIVTLPALVNAGNFDNERVTDLQAKGVAGFVLLDNRPVMVSATPIVTTGITGPAHGYVLMGRYLDRTQVDDLAAITQRNIELNRFDREFDRQRVSDAVRDDLLSSDAERPIVIEALDGDTLAGYAIIRSLDGQPLLLLEMTLPRTIYREARATITFFLGALLGVGMLFILAALLALEQQVLSPVGNLARDVSRVGTSQALSDRVRVRSRDELGRLAKDINTMLTAIEQSQRELVEKEQRLQEQNVQLAQARERAEEAARLKSQFLASMSHELRTPLNAIIGYSQLVLRGVGGDLSEKTRRNVERIHVNGQNLLVLINDVLDLAKIEAGRTEIHPAPFNLREMMDELMRQTQGLADEKQQRYSLHLDDSLPPVIVSDRDRLKQIALNLISNAIKFTSANGQISLNVKRPTEDTFEFSVTDTGIGIPPHAVDYIFDEFRQVDGSSTRQHGGTGLGLAIVRNLVVMMDGTVQVKSKVGEGSTFTVTLPLITEPALVVVKD